MLFQLWVCLTHNLIKIYFFCCNFCLGYVTNDYKKSMPDILAIGFQEICDLTATNMVWQR
jgi:hypothetical protein